MIVSKLKALCACALPPASSNSNDSSDTFQQRNMEIGLKRNNGPKKLCNSRAQDGQIENLIG